MDLLSFLSRYGISKTTNFDLKDMAIDLCLDVEVIMRDEVVSALAEHDKIIMNIQTTKDKGSQWICIHKSKGIYFDSYGVLPTKEVLKVLPNIKYNETQVQPEETEMCGQLSLYVLYKLNLGDGASPRAKGDDFETIIECINESLNFLL